MDRAALQVCGPLDLQGSDVKTCKKHAANPVYVYRQCAGCELQALREERDQARAECEALRKEVARLKADNLALLESPGDAL